MSKEYAVETRVCNGCKDQKISCKFETVVEGELGVIPCPWSKPQCDFIRTDFKWIDNPEDYFSQDDNGGGEP